MQRLGKNLGAYQGETIQIADLMNPRIDIRRNQDGRFDIGRPQMRDLGLSGDAAPAAVAGKGENGIQHFEKALELYGKLILRLQEQIKDRDDRRATDAKEIEALRAEVERLKAQSGQK